MMSIQDLIEELTYEGEKYILQHKEIPTGTIKEDSLGSIRRKYIDKEELIGVIQKNSFDPQRDIGQEERADYYGFFEPTFHIPDHELAEYRIKHIFPSLDEEEPPFIRYFRIQTIDRNLRKDNSPNHYEMTLEWIKTNTPSTE
ncbi:MAG: hypothetical protein GYA36_20595 [Veillonellaceae bacterium]|nr:hypothetical protein [Veillonellaceae bacterium]